MHNYILLLLLLLNIIIVVYIILYYIYYIVYIVKYDQGKQKSLVFINICYILNDILTKSHKFILKQIFLTKTSFL